MERFALLSCAVNGLLAVALGAFGAHGLEKRLDVDREKRLGWWQTAAHYQLTHAVALGVVWAVSREGASAATRISTWGFTLGVLLFSGSLYVMTLTNVRKLGAITPLGGLAMLAGWGGLIAAALQL